MKKQVSLYFFLFFSVSSLFALEVKYCEIKDPSKHQTNQTLLCNILEQELSHVPNKSPLDQANYLRSRISHIAETLLKRGFSSKAYAVPKADKDTFLGFNCFALWEGERKSIPLTFFVYIWPAEKVALKYYPCKEHNCIYATNIHSHPIPCTFAVLKGTLTQNNFEIVPWPNAEKIVHLVKEEKFHKGEGSIDELATPFIHQLYCKNKKLCISLHAYGLSSEEKVMACFRKCVLVIHTITSCKKMGP